ncbi:Do family serine endopeptidase [Pelagibacterium limicola]|uniref:Do family serine endopeptidase n=1 Tax=Pelagibacterium limicola TaxID=2791022 RepID=UPI0018AF8B49|nr:Do family serine endopeptidase [Pelagibacterium limicola]
MLRALSLVVVALLSISPALAQTERRVPLDAEEIRLSYAPVVREVAPAVVNVYATRITQQRQSMFGDPFFDQFFGRSPFFDTRPQESQSLGSGVIVGEDGLILTNNHVVEGAIDIRIATMDGREYPVDLVLADGATDLAALAIRNPDRTFPVAQFADSDRLEVGDLVLAIGNPFGVGQTVTSGIVSALARTGVGITDYQFFIQTDAAINPGNSGGALVDMDGRLVGINTALFTRSGGSQGIGFAIPSNMARVIATAAASGGEIVRPWFGATFQSLDSDLAAGLGLDLPRGALITDIAQDGPAARAGLRSGDVIVGIDGLAVQDPEALYYRIGLLPVDSTVALDVRRGGQSFIIDLLLETAPSNGARQAVISGDTRFAGVTVSELTPALAQSFGLGFSATGVAIIEVAPASPAQRLGLREGDIILNLNGTEIRDIETFESLASQRPRGWQITLQRGGRIIRSFVSG